LFVASRVFFRSMNRASRVAWSLFALLAASGCGGDSPGTAPAPVSGGSSPAVTLAQLSLDPVSVIGGRESKGQLTLDGAAPTGGVSVSLSSTNAVATVPSSVAVAAGATSATFAVATQAVTDPADVMVKATLGSTAKDAPLRVTPQPRLTVFTIASLGGRVLGGQPFSGAVSLDLPAPPGGARVDVTADDTAARVAAVDIPEGRESANYTFSTRLGASDVRINITASYGGASISNTLVVLGPGSSTSPPTGPPLPSIPTFFSYVSDPKNYIGLGQSLTLASPGVPFFATANCGRVGNLVTWIDTGSFNGRSYNVSFFVPGGLKVGSYTGADGGPGRPAIQIVGEGRFCDATGRFDITQLVIGPNGSVRRLRATFEHRCTESAEFSGLLVGELSLNDPPLVPGVACY
jgi:hypothetical protein